MRTSAIFSISALMAFASAAAVPAAFPAADAPSHVCVYVCSEPDWKGECEHICMSPGICKEVDAKMDDKISCIGPDKPVSGCKAFTEHGCKGKFSADLKYPDISTLAQAPGFDNKVKSFICY